MRRIDSMLKTVAVVAAMLFAGDALAQTTPVTFSLDFRALDGFARVFDNEGLELLIRRVRSNVRDPEPFHESLLRRYAMMLTPPST